MKQIILTGVAIQSETAQIVLIPQNYHEDGVEIMISVKLLEYVFSVTTFFYGYNLKTFLEEAEAIEAGQSNKACLFNYNETLTLEFITESGTTFLSFTYESILPQWPDDAALKVLCGASKSVVANRPGSHFSISFMKLHNGLIEVITWITDILANRTISSANPYP